MKVIITKVPQNSKFKEHDIVEASGAELDALVETGHGYVTDTEHKAIKAREEAEDRNQKAMVKAQESAVDVAIDEARKKGIFAPKEEVDATLRARAIKMESVEASMGVQYILSLPVKQAQKVDLTQRQTTSQDGKIISMEVVNASLDDLGKSYITASEPISGLVKAGKMKDAVACSKESGTRLKQILARGDDILLRDIIRAADYTDPNSQVGTLATGLVLMRNLGYLKNKLNWLPYFTTDLRNEPATFGQPVFTRYLGVPAVATFIPGIGFTTDSTTISNASATSVQSGIVTQTSGTRTLSVPAATDKVVTLNQFKGVPIGFPVTTLAATVRNLFAEQRGVQLYSLAEAINSFVLGQIFAATWSGIVTSISISNLDLKGFLNVKNRMELSKIPDVGRYALLHSYFYDGLQADGNLLTSKAIIALLNRDQSSFEDADMPPIFGVKPLSSQLAVGTSGSSTLGSATVSSDGTSVTFGTNNAVGFAGNMSSMLFVARVPQDFTAAAAQLGIPASYGVEIVTEPDSGLTVMIFKNVNTATWAVEVTVCLMYGAAQGDPRIGIILKP